MHDAEWVAWMVAVAEGTLVAYGVALVVLWGAYGLQAWRARRGKA